MDRSPLRLGLVVPLPLWLLVGAGVLAVVVVAGIGALSPLLGVLALVGVAVGLWLAQRPVLLALVAVIVVPVSSGLRRGLPLPGLRLSEVLTVFSAVVVLGLAARILPGPRWRLWDVAALTYCGGAFAFGLLDAALQQVPITSDDVQTMLGPMQFFLLYRMVAAAFATAELRTIAMRMLLLFSIPVSALAALQEVGPPIFQHVALSITGTTVFDTPGWDPVRRATSVFPIWHALAGYLIVVALLAIALLLRGRGEVLSSFWLLVVLGGAVVGLVFSLTATPVIGLLVGVLFIGRLLRRLGLVITWLLVGTLISLAAFFPLVSERIAAQSTATPATPTAGTSLLPQTIQYRLDVWAQQYLPALRGNWVNGFGPADPPGIAWTHTESGYLTLVLRGGLGYVAIGCLLVYLSWRSGKRLMSLSRLPSEVALAATVMALAAVLLLVNLTFPYLTASGMPQPMWVLWGLVVAALGEVESKYERERLAPRRGPAATLVSRP
ncbi:MAG: hypothetical protein F2911_10660 [Actinobacteria bacterium]|nr:hypothetical protein [Actinomycetota bacterium]MSX38008.1 hypothetical protein [Actinomycetota bacterium]